MNHVDKIKIVKVIRVEERAELFQRLGSLLKLMAGDWILDKLQNTII